MFNEYAKKLKHLKADVPEIFKRIASKGAIKFVNVAKNRTDTEKLIDTGNYKRSWNAQSVTLLPHDYGVECKNNAEYASHLEYGHKLKNGKRWKGRFVGDWALNEARYYCIQELDNAYKKAFKQQ